MINISGAPPNSIVAIPPPPYDYNYSGPANPACFLKLDSVQDWAGQSFTTTEEYFLEFIELWLKKGPGSNIGNIYVGIFAVDGSGHPTGPALASGIIDNADVSEDFSWVSCDVSDLLTYGFLNAATKYCIVVHGIGMTLNPANYLVWSCGGDGSGLPNGDQEWSINAGVDWTTDTTRDQLFRCYSPEILPVKDHYNYFNDRAFMNSEVAFSQTRWEGQTFTAIENYTIKIVRLILSADNDKTGKNVIVSIRETIDGLPIAPDLCSGTLDGNLIKVGDENRSWHEINLGSGVALSEGVKYAICVRSDDEPQEIMMWEDAIDPRYLEGNRVYSANSGVDWIPGAAYDICFETWK